MWFYFGVVAIALMAAATVVDVLLFVRQLNRLKSFDTEELERWLSEQVAP